MKNQSQLLPFEKRVVFILACIYIARMYGLFILLPILAPAAEYLLGATPILVGAALGIYGLSQVFLHASFGQWSDRIGRKPVIVFGLLLFILGCLIAANSETIIGVIVGRFLQGSGAIGAVIMACASDLTRGEQRSKVFAILGMSIGVAFLLAMMTGPILYAAWGLSGVFFVSAGFAVVSGLMVLVALPHKAPAAQFVEHDLPPLKEDGAVATRVGFWQTIKNKELLRLNGGTLVLHYILMANFLVLPAMIDQHLGLSVSAHWQFYVPILLGSFVLMLPVLVLAERNRKLKTAIVGMIFTLTLSQWFMEYLGEDDTMLFILSAVLFFTAFSYLEANLPSLVSRVCPVHAKGVSLGVFMQSQFLGTFCGGLIGGFLLQLWGVQAVFNVNLLLAILWFFWMLGMAPWRNHPTR